MHDNIFYIFVYKNIPQVQYVYMLRRNEVEKKNSKNWANQGRLETTFLEENAHFCVASKRLITSKLRIYGWIWVGFYLNFGNISTFLPCFSYYSCYRLPKLPFDSIIRMSSIQPLHVFFLISGLLLNGLMYRK